MRLEKIRLAGFKSFVDPTTIPTPGNLVGIVGPNGCGKSNVIDAVRWVMGESSAKHLRGESMSDVIFNGSSSRKPVGIASVELVFDNQDGKAPGELAGYPQISIKRQVSREGQSVYFLNGTKCRRKDITDLFLGTGLGSRSYAIIEQGTISRLIEAKPAELRELIEEAAGISKYKERRHETELRMGHTAENLARLEDVCEEARKQLENLKRQAKKAERFTILKAEERHTKEQLLSRRWHHYDQQIFKANIQLERLESQVSELLESGIENRSQQETLRNQHEQTQEAINREQANFYELGSEIGRIHQALKHAKEKQDSLINEQKKLGEEIQRAQEDLDSDQLQIKLLESEETEVTEKLSQLIERENEATLNHRELQTNLDNLNHLVTDSLSRLTQADNQKKITESQLKNTQYQINQLEERLRRIEAEKVNLENSSERHHLELLEQDHELIESELEEINGLREELINRLNQSKEISKALQDKVNTLKAQLYSAEGTIKSLETLQSQASGGSHHAVHRWLESTGGDATDILAKYLEVEAGWETAVESVLQSKINALCIENLWERLPNPEDLKGEALTLIEKTSPNLNHNPAESEDSVVKTTSKISAATLFKGIRFEKDQESALRTRGDLVHGEQIVTRDGVLIGKNWISFNSTAPANQGVIKRERELRELMERKEVVSLSLKEAEHEQEHNHTRLSDYEKQREELSAKEKKARSSHSELSSKISVIRVKESHIEQRAKQLAEEQRELLELSLQRREEQETLIASSLEFDQILENTSESAEELKHRRSNFQEQFSRSSEKCRELSISINALKSRLESTLASKSLTQRHLERAKGQLELSLSKLESIQARFSQLEITQENPETDLESLLTQKSVVEQNLNNARSSELEIKRSLKLLAEEQLQLEKALDQAKSGLETLRVEISSTEVRKQTIHEQLIDLDADPQTVLQNLPDNFDEDLSQTRLNEIIKEVERLGPVNLMALEESVSQEERLHFLEQQNQDLRDSLATLKEAIDKIDRECRSRFKDTFDQINAGLQEMFPKLFGGGRASLAMTDTELLEAGVTVMAHPPGKRNSSIHLLSGGEKALTAAALVFAIFELNPAPFCLLDEVDAPLDDANVGRFSQLVKEMSERVQFLFISHNKATMEIADHLAGVTMKEPGVSRIVSVDLDAAIEMSGT